MTPQIGHGWVFHARPAKNKTGVQHSFRYPTFNLLLPTENQEFLHRLARGIFLQVRAEDYLEGQKGDLDFLIRSFLKKHCHYEAEQILLQTLPRMLGYVFNPVSFWLCLKKDQLDAVLCEVNNTFGDRHFYFLKSKQGTLEKEFHVSPFLAISGNYDFHFQFSKDKSDIQILLKDQDNVLLTTRLNLDLKEFSEQERKSLWLRYGWFSLMVIARIHWQALRLWSKKARFHKRPLPPKEKVSL